MTVVDMDRSANNFASLSIYQKNGLVKKDQETKFKQPNLHFRDLAVHCQWITRLPSSIKIFNQRRTSEVSRDRMISQ